MRILMNVVGTLLVIMGAVWFLQGINVLLGSPMTGQSQWVIFGGGAVVVGLVLLVVANRGRSATPGLRKYGRKRP